MVHLAQCETRLRKEIIWLNLPFYRHTSSFWQTTLASFGGYVLVPVWGYLGLARGGGVPGSYRSIELLASFLGPLTSLEVWAESGPDFLFVDVVDDSNGGGSGYEVIRAPSWVLVFGFRPNTTLGLVFYFKFLWVYLVIRAPLTTREVACLT